MVFVNTALEHRFGNSVQVSGSWINLDRVLLNATHLLYRPGTHEYIQKYKKLYMYRRNIHILHGPGPGRALGPGTWVLGRCPGSVPAAAQGPARGRALRYMYVHICMYNMYMYIYICICICICVCAYLGSRSSGKCQVVGILETTSS